MAVSVTKPSGESRVDDVRALRFRVRDLTFSSNYTDDGEIVTADDVGLKRIVQVHAPGVVTDATDDALANPLGIQIADDGSQVNFLFYDSAADGDALDEKPAEAHVCEGPIRVTFIGY